MRNITSWNTSYNVEHWFLFFLISFISAYITSRYIAVYKLYDTILARVLTILGFLFAFGIGIMMHRVSTVRPLRIKKLEGRSGLTIGLLLLLISFRCLFKTGAFHTFYVFFFIMLFLHLPLHRNVRSFLVIMGEYSMPMWMIHTFFCNYLFKDFIFGFQYPLVIYLVLVGISLVCSIPIMKCANWACKKLVI